MSNAGRLSEYAARLHSRYQPRLEAARYINAINLPPNIDCFILIEPGMGYVIDALRESRPEAGIIALHAEAAFRATAADYPDVPMWFPDSGMGVQDFLEAHIPETAAARIIEWRPSLRLFGDRCLELVRHSTDFIKRAEASRRTGAVFGRRWVRNFFRNAALIRRTLRYRTMDLPVLVAGSGPSLEAALPDILAMREHIFVLAASSAVPALAAGGIMPDMVIATDGGTWALWHLYACFRVPLANPAPVKLAAALSAALPSQCAAMPLLPVNDGSLWQSMVLHGMGIPSVLLPQRGTVTASAIELAMLLTSGNILLAGLDLAVADITSHARPNAFDHLMYGSASRLRPVYSQYFTRSGAIRDGGSLEVYAAWFKTRIAGWSARVFSLGGNHPVFENSLPKLSPAVYAGTKNAAGDFFKEIPVAAMEFSHGENSNGFARGKTAVTDTFSAANILINALDNTQYADTLKSELGPLLFPQRPDVSAAEIAGELRRKNG